MVSTLPNAEDGTVEKPRVLLVKNMNNSTDSEIKVKAKVAEDTLAIFKKKNCKRRLFFYFWPPRPE